MNKVYDVITDRIIEALEKGVVPWQKPWKSKSSFPMNLISGKKYRGINVFLLGCQSFDSPYWLTFKQAKQLKGNVKKGQKGSPCVFWSITDKMVTDEDTGEVKKKKSFILRYYTVFNYDQCENIEHKRIAELKTEMEGESLNFNPIVECEMLVNNFASCPDIRHGIAQAFYSPAQDYVNMPKVELFNSNEEYYSTLFHELTHSTGHEDRLNRFKDETHAHAFGSASYSKEELVAEMGASFLCGMSGIENKTIDNSVAYIQNWIKALKSKDNRKMVINASAQAQKAVDHITGEQHD